MKEAHRNMQFHLNQSCKNKQTMAKCSELSSAGVRPWWTPHLPPLGNSSDHPLGQMSCEPHAGAP